MKITIIQYGSEEYNKMITLRMEVLRIPLGLSFSDEDLKKEEQDILVGAFEEDKIIGCCVLTEKYDYTLQLRQMAVDPARQGQKIGKVLLDFAEQLAKDKGYTTLMMHARKVATGFYLKCGYVISGAEFTEVGIPHYKMEKKLKQSM